jgi:hypothetical protein
MMYYYSMVFLKQSLRQGAYFVYYYKMKNPTFEIYINDRLITTAAITSEFGVLTAITTWVNSSIENHSSLRMEITGLDTTNDSYLTWHKQDLVIGDELKVKITDNVNISIPTTNPKISEEEHLERKISYFHRLKEELKDYI